MFIEETVFVVGAGASMELGLPSGPELASQISLDANFKWQQNRFIEGNKKLHDFAHLLSQQFSGDAVSTAHKLSKGLTLAASIDNFIATHLDDPFMVAIGKAAIVNRILLAEQNSYLYYRTNPNDWNTAQVKKSWLMPFFHKLVSGVKQSEISNIFRNVSIISFNYDRCIESFLCTAISRYFDCDILTSFSIVSGLKIVRPYGSIAPLARNDTVENALTYGAEPSVARLSHFYQNIKTFSEDDPDKDILHAAQNLVLKARKIVFLGLAFHAQNIPFYSVLDADKLGPRQLRGLSPKVFATAYSRSKADVEYIYGELNSCICNAYQTNSAEIYVENLKCEQLLRDYSKSI
ncbi:MAG: hypothetical protein EP335_13335 [Alphaproteobacteria bacterium]|nr:MAG: hypothetical protein EP335_13335 [Alphaproteobacteria bacterium]